MAIAEDAGCSGPPLLVGHSMGGMVTIVTAAIHGERLTGAVIVDSPVRKPDPESAEAEHGKAFRNPKTYPTLDEAVAHFHLVPEQPCEHDFLADYVARHSLRQTDAGWSWKFDPRIFVRFPPKTLHDYLARGAVPRRAASRRALCRRAARNRRVHVRPAQAQFTACRDSVRVLDQPIAFLAALRALLADWEHSVPRRRAAAT